MAREPSVTQEQVSATANEITNNGGKATSRSVREVLGAGSQATICKLLSNWKSGQERKSDAIDDTLNPVIAKSISNEIANKVQTATAELTIKIADLQSEFNFLITENENQSTKLDELTDSVNSLQEQNNLLKGQNTQLEASGATLALKLEAERSEVKEVLSKLAKAELRLENVPRIESELKECKEQLAVEISKSAMLHEKEAVASARLQMANEESKGYQARLESTLAELNQIRINQQALQSRFDTVSGELSQVKINTEKREFEVKQLQEFLTSANRTIESLQSNVNELKNNTDKKDSEIKQLHKTIENSQSKTKLKPEL